MKRVVVIGGGIAGLSCATVLSREQFRVTLIERRPYLGGRACTQPTTPPMDNGPHLVSGNYRMLRDLLALAGQPLEFDRNDVPVVWYDEIGKRHRLTPGKSPVYTLWELFRSFGFESFRFTKSLRSLSQSRNDQLATVEDWLNEQKLRKEIRQFVRLLVLSTMNTPPEHADFTLFRIVILESLLQKGEYAKLQRFHPLSDKIIEPLRVHLLKNKVEILTGVPVTRIDRNEDMLSVIRGSDVIECDEVVLALPASGRKALHQEPAVLYSPIVTARLLVNGVKPGWFGFNIGAVDWVFLSQDEPTLLEAVTSGNSEWAAQPNPEIYRLVSEQVKKVFPNFAVVKELGVVKELVATPLQTPDWQRNRFAPQTSERHVWRAADDLATGLPATIESAACSGVWAAFAVTGKMLGKPGEICPRRLS